MANQTTFRSQNIDARPFQLHLLKVERRGMRPMAANVLSRTTSKKAKIAAVAGVAAMLVSLQGTSDAYAAKLDLGSASAALSSKVLENAVACCDNIAKSVSVGAPESAVKQKVLELFILIDAEHQRLESFADEVGARLVKTNAPNRQQADDDGVTGGGGEKTNVFWLRNSERKSSTEKLNSVKKAVTGGGGEKTNVSWLNQHSIQGQSDSPSSFQ